MVFLAKESIMNLLDGFEIIKFEEIEKDGNTATGKNKHWHVYDVIAKKL